MVPNKPALRSVSPVSAVCTEHHREGVDVGNDYMPASSDDPREFSDGRPQIGTVGQRKCTDGDIHGPIRQRDRGQVGGLE